MVKSIDTIREELIEKGCLCAQSVQDLKWHLENDLSPHMPIILATDAGLRVLGPFIAKHLEHKDNFIRERAVACLIGRLFLSEYAPKALKLAKEDPYENVRGLAIANLGAVIDDVDKKLKREIAEYIYEVVTSSSYDNLFRSSAYHSIIVAMEVPPKEWPRLQLDPDMEKLVDRDLLEAFRKKYGIEKPLKK